MTGLTNSSNRLLALANYLNCFSSLKLMSVSINWVWHSLLLLSLTWLSNKVSWPDRPSSQCRAWAWPAVGCFPRSGSCSPSSWPDSLARPVWVVVYIKRIFSKLFYAQPLRPIKKFDLTQTTFMKNSHRMAERRLVMLTHYFQQE